jgi:hypothetical protein
MANPFVDTFHPAQSGLAKDMIKHTGSGGSATVAGDGNVGIGIYVEVAGTIAFESAAGNNRQVVAAAGAYIVCGVKQILATTTVDCQILVI